MSFLLGVFIVLALLSAWLTGWVRHYALVRLLDVPNARSSHTRPTPRGGGLGIVVVLLVSGLLAFVYGFLPLSLAMALSAAIPLAVIGFIDDHGDVPARWRFVIQVASAAWAIYWIGGMEVLRVGAFDVEWGLIGYPFGILVMVWMLNLFNFMDGIDGIEASEVIFIGLGAAFLISRGLGFALVPEMLAPLAISAATLGFLVWNWPPARIFMGDVGSGVLGFLLALLMLQTAVTGKLSFFIWIILSGVFLVDATVTLLIRLYRGERWYQAHRSHAYQHASRRYGGHKVVTLGVIFINLFWLLPMASLAQWKPELEFWLALAALFPLAYAAIWLGAGRP
jgi:Fuc2NAc and GlcNAc transferase